MTESKPTPGPRRRITAPVVKVCEEERILNEFYGGPDYPDFHSWSQAKFAAVAEILKPLRAQRDELLAALRDLLKWETEPEARYGARLHARQADVDRARAALAKASGKE